MSVNAENLTTIFVLSGIFCFCVYPVSSNYTACKRFYGRTPPLLAVITEHCLSGFTRGDVGIALYGFIELHSV